MPILSASMSSHASFYPFSFYFLMSFFLFPMLFIFFIFFSSYKSHWFPPQKLFFGSFHLLLIWMDTFQRMIVIKFCHCWVNKRKRISDRKSCFVILNEASKCSHFLSHFSFIIYSFLENNYFQCKNPPTLPFVVYSLI